MDIVTDLEIAETVAADQNPLTTLKDIQTIYGVYTAVNKAGKLDLSVMVKDGTLSPVVAAVMRTSTLLNKVLADPKQGPALLSVLESVL